VKLKNPKDKGNKWELEVAKGFSEWLKCPIRRTPGSGGWGTSTTSSDLLGVEPNPNDPDYEGIKTRLAAFKRIFVECKNVESLNPIQLMSDQGEVTAYMNKALADANLINAYVVLVCKRNRQDPIVIFDENGLSLLTAADYRVHEPNFTLRYYRRNYAVSKLQHIFCLPLREDLGTFVPKPAPKQFIFNFEVKKPDGL